MARADWDRLSASVDRAFRKDKPKTEVRLRGIESPQPATTAHRNREVSRHQITLNNASTSAVASPGRYSDSARIETLDRELAELTDRLEKGWAIMGGFDLPDITDPQRRENLSATWERLNYEAAEKAREFIALTGRMWRRDA